MVPRRWAPDTLDPITLEPLGNLAYPPFELRADEAKESTNGDYFDGRELASYLVRTRSFIHPVSRRLITRQDCCLLDVYLRRHRIGRAIADVVKVFDSHFHPRRDALPAAVSVSPMGTAAASSQPSRSASAARAAARGARSSQVSDRDGGLVIVDDDMVPNQLHATSAVRPVSAVVSAADYGEWPSAMMDQPMARSGRGNRRPRSSRRSPAAQAESFPALPSSAAQPAASAPPALPPAVAAASAARAAAREAAAEAAATAEETARAAAIAMRTTARGERSQEAAMAMVSDAATIFSGEALNLAKSTPDLVAEIERHFDILIGSGATSRQLRPMPRQHRRLVHELSHVYGIGAIAAGIEPHRALKLYRTDRLRWPDLLLSEADALGAAQHTAVSESAGASGRSGGWSIRFYSVECAEKALSSFLGARSGGGAHGEYTVQWQPERRSERAQARDRGLLEATVTFQTEAAARQALDTVGGGRRGLFRTERPSWASGDGQVGDRAAGDGGDCDGRSTRQVECVLHVANAEAQLSLRVLPTGGQSSSAGGAGSGAASTRGGSRPRRRRANVEEMPLTADQEALVTLLAGMGFDRRAGMLASRKVRGSGEVAVLEAIEWLGSEEAATEVAEAQSEAAKAERAVVAMEEMEAAEVGAVDDPADRAQQRKAQGERGGMHSAQALVAQPRSHARPVSGRGPMARGTRGEARPRDALGPAASHKGNWSVLLPVLLAEEDDHSDMQSD